MNDTEPLMESAYPMATYDSALTSVATVGGSSDANAKERSTKFDTPSLNDLMEWIKRTKGKKVKMSALILATALKINGSMTSGNTCVVDRILRDEPPNDTVRDSDTRNLSGVIQDANKMHSYFLQQSNLSESEPFIQNSTQDREDIIKSLKRRFRTRSSGVIFLYYTGHGIENTGDWAIARANEGRGFDRITLDDVIRFWRSTKQYRHQGCHLIIIADSCFSGQWVAKLDKRRKSSDSDVVADVQNISMLASCRPYEPCYETKDGGDFTKYLLEPLRSHPIHTKDIGVELEMDLDNMSVRDSHGDNSDEIRRQQYGNGCGNLIPCLLCPCDSCIDCCIGCRSGCLGICDSITNSYEEHPYLCICLCILLIIIFPLCILFIPLPQRH